MKRLEVTLPATAAGCRLDAALAAALPEWSRSAVTRLLREGAILVNGLPAKPSGKAAGGERVTIAVPEPAAPAARPENIPLSIIFEDADLIVVDKPPGLVVHPGAGRPSGTLAGALLYHCTDLSGINGVLRPGIVHRLDKDTSGVIVAAKNDFAHQCLAAAFADRSVKKEYLALCLGAPTVERFECAGAIIRHPTRRKEMTVARRAGEGRAAYTAFEVLERFPGVPLAALTEAGAGTAGGAGTVSFFLARARPRTGRTHQIRVHAAHLGFPVAADPVYGRRRQVPIPGLTRHALHAARLSFPAPRTGETVTSEAPLPTDMTNALELLRRLSRG